MVVSKTLSLHDGLRLIAKRASLMKSKWGAERGTMLAVFSGRDAVEQIARDVSSNSAETQLEIACFNSPASQVLVAAHLPLLRPKSWPGEKEFDTSVLMSLMASIQLSLLPYSKTWTTFRNP